MKNIKEIKAWSAVIIIGILISAILLMPTNSVMATVMTPDVGAIQQNHHLDKKTQAAFIAHALQNDTKKLEQDFRKAYNISADTEIYVEVSTNPPPILHKFGEIIPAGTKVYAWDEPVVNPLVVLPVGAMVIVLAIVIMTTSVVIYVVYRMLKKLDQIINPPRTTNEISNGMTAISYKNNPEFQIASALPTVITNVSVVCSPVNNFDFDTMTGIVVFNIQTSTDLRTWNTELKVINTITAGKSSLVVYDGLGVPIITNNSSGLFDGTNLIYAPADVSGVIIKDSTRDAQKYWRFQP